MSSTIVKNQELVLESYALQDAITDFYRQAGIVLLSEKTQMVQMENWEDIRLTNRKWNYVS